MAEELVIFDLDGTLADISERVHYIKRKPKKTGTHLMVEQAGR